MSTNSQEYKLTGIQTQRNTKSQEHKLRGIQTQRNKTYRSTNPQEQNLGEMNSQKPYLAYILP